MANRRWNAKKIAQTPSLKKKMARFCAHVDITYPDKIKDYKALNFEEVLTYGHRGYVSFSEDDLAKAFDNRVEIVRDHYSALKEIDDLDKVEDGRSHRPQTKFIEVTLWYEEAVEIADAIFEKDFLG